MADDLPAGFSVSPGPSYSNSMTPDQYFAAVKSAYPNAVFNGGGRTPQQNAAVGGVPNSMHLTNQAMDFNVPGVPSAQVFARLRQMGLPETEELAEGQEGSQGPHLHVGWRPKGPATPVTDGLPAGFSVAQPAHDALPQGFSVPGAAPAAPQQRAGATGLGMVGETIGDFFNPHPDHAPNALESGIMGVTNNNNVKALTASYQNGALNGLFLEPTRQVMETLGVGMDKLKSMYPGQTDQWYKDKYHEAMNQAVISSRAQAQAQSKLATYPGHQAVNFVASALGQPEMLAMGGSGTGASVAARVVSAGIKNAAIAGASNTAAQLMDKAEGVKKDFDVGEALTQAGGGAVLGAGMHGATEAAPVVSDFVKGLFKNRGMDTTPGVDPRGATSPMTGPTPTMTPDEQVQFKQLLKTGSVDDIKGFLASKQGPKPTYQDVNNLVQLRDSLPPNYMTGRENFDEAVKSHAADMEKSIVANHINETTQDWQNAPKFEIIHSSNEIADPLIRGQAIMEDHDGTALGFLGHDGVVRIYGNRVQNADQLNALIYHEGLGHFGLAQQFGDKLDSTLQTLLDRNVGQFGKRVDAWQKANPDAYGGDRLRAAEEVLAEDSQNGQLKPGLRDALVAHIRNFGRKMGLNLSYSDGDIQHILAMSHDAVVSGVGRDAASTGFTGNKFMFTGKNATGFNPGEGFTASDGQPRNEISDNRSHLISDDNGSPMIKTPGIHKLGDVLNHPDLYAQYPHLKDMPVNSTYLHDGSYGAYSPEVKQLYVDRRLGNNEMHKTLLHETQHAIQDHEGQMQTFDPQYASKAEYQADPIEQEAFATEGRLGMSPQERASNTPTFMRASQYKEKAGNGYVASDEHIEDIAKHLEANYVPNKVTDAEVRRKALEYGISPSAIRDLAQRDPGELAARITRLGMAADYSDMQLTGHLEKLGSADWSAGDYLKLSQLIATRDYNVERFKGEGNEAGRALRAVQAFQSYKNDTLADTLQRLKDEGSGLETLAEGGPEALKFAQQLKDALKDGKNPGAVNSLIKGVSKPYWWQYLTSFHYNAMLSGMSTHVKAPLDMMTGIAQNVIDHAIANPVGKLYNLVENLTGQTVKPGIDNAEVASRVYGVLRSVFDHEVYRQSLHAIKTGEGNTVLPSGQSIPTNPSTMMLGTNNPRLGPVLSKPTDLIVAQDSFFRSHAVSQNLYGLGNRQARADLGPKASLDDVFALGSTYAHNPSTEMLAEARLEAEKSLLLNHNGLTDWIDKMKQVRPNMSPGQQFATFVAQNIAPFVRVASNSLVTRTIARSPLPLLNPGTWTKLAEGGPEAHLMVSRMLYGTAKLGILWGLAAEGKHLLTGEGPDDYRKKEELEASGWQPNAVHENGTYNTGGQLAMSLNPFDVHNSTAQMVKSLRDAYEKGANKGQVANGLKLAMGSIMHDFMSQSWVNDVGPTIEASLAEGNGAGELVARTAGAEAKTWVPNVINQSNRLMHPNLKDTRPDDADRQGDISGSIINSIKSAIAPDELPDKYSVLGDPIPNGQSITGVHTILPGLGGNNRPENTDPVHRELYRLATLPNVTSAIITPVERRVKIDNPQDPDGEKIWKTLTTKDFENYQRVVGRNIVEGVRQQMNSPEWASMSDSDKIAAVRQIESDAKSDVREGLFNNGGQ